ncbi:unnamed protein product [Candidula unifasciata]|uniref:G-protein coupled receptors family 1 profile domain-containing protein n=1 Tax=Candidula unifasciata TaxID=100452 RepID=A0A8S3YI95_9EUPU|nr:unnamed protein product [Candidula unifasciata]
MSTIPGRAIPDLTLQMMEGSAERDMHIVIDTSEKTFANNLHFIMSAVIGPVVCLLGMAGNILSIITWQRPGMGGSTGRYLIGQGVANLCLLLMFLLCDSLQYWLPAVKYSVIYGAFFSYFGFPVFYLAITCSIWYTVGLTVDRYIMVCWITKAKRLCNEARANVGLVLITLNSFMINVPHFASFTPVFLKHSGEVNNSNIEKPKVAFTQTNFGAGEGGKFYEFWIHCIVLILVPWVSVLYMNIMIILKISEANNRMADKKTSQSLKKSKESENQITRLLLCVTFTFLFCIGLQCIAQCLWMKKPPGANLLMVSASYSFGKTGILFNSSLNFVLYCLTGKRFRIELLKMFGLINKDLLLSSSMNTSTSNISTTSSGTPSSTRPVTKSA